jgi:hypothetical protein
VQNCECSSGPRLLERGLLRATRGVDGRWTVDRGHRLKAECSTAVSNCISDTSLVRKTNVSRTVMTPAEVHLDIRNDKSACHQFPVTGHLRHNFRQARGLSFQSVCLAAIRLAPQLALFDMLFQYRCGEERRKEEPYGLRDSVRKMPSS